MPGLDSTGFTPKSLATIKEDLEAAARASFGLNVNVEADGVLGILIGILSSSLDTIWQGSQALYDSFNLHNAAGVQLDNLANLSGLTRLMATKSTATLSLTGTDGTVIPQGSLVSVGAGGEQFATDNKITFTATGGPSGVPGGSGTATAVNTGAIVAVAAAISTIVTPVSGWTAVTNAADATKGRASETDAELRKRVLLLPAAIGSTTLPALQADISNLSFLTDSSIVENTTGATVGTRPAHSFEVIVDPAPTGDNIQTLVDTIFINKPAGIQAYGALSGSYTDAASIVHSVGYTTATVKNVRFTITITKNSQWPADGESQVRTALATAVSALHVGDDVKHFEMVGAISAVAGIESLTVTQALTPYGGGDYVSTNLVIADTERAAINDSTSATEIAITVT